LLQVGTAADTVDVTGEVSQMQTETARVATAVSTALVDELPLAPGTGKKTNKLRMKD